MNCEWWCWMFDFYFPSLPFNLTFGMINGYLSPQQWRFESEELKAGPQHSEIIQWERWFGKVRCMTKKPSFDAMVKYFYSYFDSIQHCDLAAWCSPGIDKSQACRRICQSPGAQKARLGLTNPRHAKRICQSPGAQKARLGLTNPRHARRICQSPNNQSLSKKGYIYERVCGSQ